MNPIRIHQCSENGYGKLYEFYPPVWHTLKDTHLPNGLETRYNKKYANWTCSSDDESRMVHKLEPVCHQLEKTLQDTIYWTHGFYTTHSGIVLETQPLPRITTHKLFRHAPGEIWTYESLTPGFQAKDVDVECKNIHVNDDGKARMIWYMKSITPKSSCVHESRK